MIRKLLREALNSYKSLTEIDWEDTFSDVNAKCIPTKQVVEYLNDVLANADLVTAKRKKFTLDKPFVHSKSSFFKYKSKIDIEDFIEKITQIPENIIGTNSKMEKTGGLNVYVYKTGIPALTGIVYDIEKNEFRYINTCPGAGTCIKVCYARRGRFIQYPNSYDKMTRVLNYLMNYPDKFEEQLYNELKAKCIQHKALKGYINKVAVRWNDSGDFFTKKYVEIAVGVIDRLYNEGYNIEDYVYTKIANVAKGEKLKNVTFSLGANKRETEKMQNAKQVKLSSILPKDVFQDLNLQKLDDIDELKTIISNIYEVSKKLIITYQELMSKPEGDEKKWYVIITPNDGDDAARRKDVIHIILTEH